MMKNSQELLLQNRSILTLCLTVLILIAGCNTFSNQDNQEFAQQEYPNILIITVDNVGYGDLQIYNKESQIITPNIDRFAREGAILTDFYTAGQTCTTSRSSLLTGRVPKRNKLDRQLAGIPGNYGIGLRHSEILIPEVIKKSPGNYATGAFGKWNIGFAPGSRPTERGFDEYLGHASGNIDHFTHVYAGKHDLFHNLESINRHGEYSTDLFADSAIEFIKDKTADSQPWFVYLPFDAPHSPGERNIAPDEPHIFQAPDYAFEPYGFTPDERDPKKRYQAVVTAIDMAIGRLLGALDSLGIAENTFVFFYSDNGANLGSLQERITGTKFSTNFPLRGGRNTLYEGAIRVPAIVKWGGKIESGSIINTRLWSPDLFVASAKLSGSHLPIDRFIDGKDPLPVLTGQTKYSPHATLYFDEINYAALHWGNWKIVRHDPNESWELYNLEEDISEVDNLAIEREDLVEKLSAAFNQKKNEIQSYHEIESIRKDN